MAYVVIVLAGSLVVGTILYFMMIYNSLVAVNHEVDRAWSNIDVLLKERHDELPKLVATVEGYMEYEQSTLKKIIEARGLYANAKSVGEKVEADGILSSSLNRLFALSENYPKLRADVSYSQLQHRISRLEEMIADRREFYNAAVNAYNIKIEQIPEVFVASRLHYQAKELYLVRPKEVTDVSIKLKIPA
jgi:LemA protein